MLTQEEALQLSSYIEQEQDRLVDDDGEVGEEAWEQYRHAGIVWRILENLFRCGNYVIEF